MGLKDSFIGELKYEAELTKKMLERVPMDKKDWKPHEKSMTLGRLATHIAEIPHWITDILIIDDFDLTPRPFQSHTASSQDELMKIFSENFEMAINKLSEADDEAFNKKWILRRGEKVIRESPKKVAIRGMGFSHLFHHRGQLSVFLRLLDIPVPGMYGPTADER